MSDYYIEKAEEAIKKLDTITTVIQQSTPDEPASPQQLADEHWTYVGSVCNAFMEIAAKMYKDAFIHGYKHGQEDMKEPEQ